jgi:hypothetical protein
MTSDIMSLNYIENMLVDAEKARPDEVLGCSVTYSVSGPDIYMHIEGDNTPLLDSLLEMADKGDLTQDWFLQTMEGDFPFAWFCFDRAFPYEGAKAMVRFNHFPELDFIPATAWGYKRLRFAPHVKLGDLLEANAVRRIKEDFDNACSGAKSVVVAPQDTPPF